MKFLVLGRNGMAGHTVSLYLKERGHQITGFARGKSDIVDTLKGDAFNQKYLVDIIKTGNYDCVVNCIGVLNQNAESMKSEAVYLNAYLLHLLADVTCDMKTQIIHVSTDCVFSGKRGEYTESDLRDGEKFYDRTKALGEIENKKDFTIRTSIIGPDMNVKGMGLLNWFLCQTDTVQGYSKAFWTGITTLQLAKLIECAVKQKAYGLYNLVPKEKISKYDLLVLFKKYLRNDDIKIEHFEKLVVDKSLKRTRYEYEFDIPGYDVMLAELAEWMNIHRELYPHYVLEERII